MSELMANESSRYERFSGFLSVLASPLPVIAVVEDVHWADDATRDLVVFVARRVADTNAVVIVTCRDDEIAAWHPLRTVLGHLATVRSVRRLTLCRLSQYAVAELAADHDVDPARVYEVTGGNPFFVAEVLAAGGASVPTTVRHAVLARASPLSPSARDALETAAVVPGHAELDLVRAAARCDAAAIDECEQIGLLHTAGGSVQFRHELARLAIERSVSGARLSELHARVLDYLEKRFVADPARLAYHAYEAGDGEAVLTYAPAAAEQADRLGAHREVQAQLARAVDYAEALPATQRAELLERYAESCNAIGMFATAVDAAHQARADWQQLGDVLQVARMAACLAGPLWNSGRFQEAYESADEAVSMLDGLPESPAHAFVYARAASVRVVMGDIDAAVGLGSRAVALAERCDDDSLLALSLNRLGISQWQVDADQAEATLRRALEVARRSGDDEAVGAALGNLGSGAGEARRYSIADFWLRECTDWCVARDLDYHHGHALAWTARSAFEQGRWGSAASLLGGIGASADIPHVRTNVLTVLGRLRVRRGDRDPGTSLTEAWDLAVPTRALQRLWPVAAGRAEGAWLAGHPGRIPALVEETYQLALSLPHQSWAKGELAFWLWRAGVIDSAPDGVAEPYRMQIAGDWRSAAETWDTIGCPYEAALARADSDEHDDLCAALDVFAQLGAKPMVDRVAERARELGGGRLPRRPSRATLQNPAGLTSRELEVLALLAAGRTNPEIATALHISRKTAGHHVSAILAKLNVHSRRDAALAAHELSILPRN